MTHITFIPLGEMYMLSNETESVVDTDDAWHMLSLSEISAGELDGWTYADGVRGTDIVSYETYDDDASTLVTTTAAHNLSAGDFISITGTTNYNDLYEVLSAPSATTFEIDKAWDTNDDATGTYARGATLTAGAHVAGIYNINWHTTISPAVNAHVFTMSHVINKTPCTKCRARQKLGTAGDFNTMGGQSKRSIAAGDKVTFAFRNIGATGNCTFRHGNLGVERIR